MDIITSLIPIFVIVSIVFSIINKAKQTQNNSTRSKTVIPGTQRNSLSLQDIIRQQIEAQKNAMNPTPPPSPQIQPIGEGNFTDVNSLENTPTEMQRHSHDVHLNEPYNEGDALNRGTLEGMPTEMQRYSSNLGLGGSYNEGAALDRYSFEDSKIVEYVDKFDLDETSKATKSSKKSTKAKRQALSKSEFRELRINRNSVVTGIIMAEILGKRGGRRAMK